MRLARIFLVLAALAVLLVVTVADDVEDKSAVKQAEDGKVEKDSKDKSSTEPIAPTATSYTRDTSDGHEDNTAETAASDDEESESDYESDSTIEANPDYVSDDEESDYESDDEYDPEDEEEEKDPKSVLNKALNPTMARKMGRKTVSFVNNNRLKITVALALIAFRHEIGRFAVSKIAPTIGVDPITGKMIRNWIKVEPTAVLKVVVFIDIMRQLQGAGKQRNPVMIAFLLLGARNPILSSLISKAILQENNSFVPQAEQHYTFERLNDRYKKDCLALQKASSHKTKPELSLPSLSSMHESKTPKEYSETVIVLDLVGVDSARIDRLRDEVSFLLHQHREDTIPYNSTNATSKNVEVVVLLESPGGSASDFALASQQLLRLRNEPGIQVTVCVDKVAASGGYMIACAASPGRLFAAPFAVLGSIGVVGQTVNIQKMLEGWGITPMVFRAGKEKAPLGLIGDVTSRQTKTIQTMLDDTHKAFKQHVVIARPLLASKIDQVANGKIWLGASALEVGLIDHIVTSDEYIAHRVQCGARLLKLMRNYRKRTLFGGNPSRGGFETHIKSSIVEPFKQHTKKVLMNLAENIDLPADELMDMLPLSAKATASGVASMRASQSTTNP